MSATPFIWPRMDESEAVRRLDELGEHTGPDLDLGLDRFSFTGVGRRAGGKEIETLRNGIVEIASEHGFRVRHGYDQERDPGREGRSSFDIAVFRTLPELMPMDWSEAGAREVWSWCAIALLPDVTHWRWRWARNGTTWNKERWLGSDLTRHTYGRQWWRSVQLADDPDLVERLGEADFNQITERANTIGANPRLIAVLARRLIARAGEEETTRRDLLRDVTRRLQREMYYIEDAALTEHEMTVWIDRLIDASVRELVRAAGGG